jgi:Predicted membrane protein (DUF2306)
MEYFNRGFMTDITGDILVTAPPLKRQHNWLNYSAKYWFIVTAIGQWLFVVYLIGYYGARFVGNGIEGFEGTHLANGFIVGDGIGNIALVFHVLMAGAIIAAGQIQLIPRIRHKIPHLHRYSGWFYMFASVIVSIAGIYLAWSRDRVIGSLIQDIGVTGSGVLVMLFMPIALYYAVKRNIAMHRRWALRLFMVVSAVWYLRLMIFGWFVATGGVGIDVETFSGPFLNIVSFAQYLLPLAVLELYFWAQKTKNEIHCRAVAGLVLLMSLAMTVGVVGVSISIWFPYIGT